MDTTTKAQSSAGRAGKRDDDTIKVIVRFKGNEVLPKEELNRWQSNRQGNEIVTPANPDKDDGKGKTFTFDHVLLGCSEDKMYSYAARETVEQFTKGYNGTIFAYG